MLDIDRAIDRLLEREGGDVNHPSDRGGPTKYGITQRTLSVWRGRPVAKEDVERLTVTEARVIYRNMYWSAPRLDTLSGLHPATADLLFDMSVHHGHRTAIRLLQRVSGATEDGTLGPKTRAAVARLSAADLHCRLCAARVALLASIVQDDPTQVVFCEGWANRVAEFIIRAQEVR